MYYNYRYPKTDVVILCINLSDKNTLINLSSTWIPEIKRYCNDKPIILGNFLFNIIENGRVIEILTGYILLSTFKTCFQWNYLFSGNSKGQKNTRSIFKLYIWKRRETVSWRTQTFILYRNISQTESGDNYKNYINGAINSSLDVSITFTLHNAPF